MFQPTNWPVGERYRDLELTIGDQVEPQELRLARSDEVNVNHTQRDAFPQFEGKLPDAIDTAAIERMRIVATLLDSAVRVPGTEYRVGIDPVIGILPGIGDVLSAGIAGYILLESAYLGVSVPTLIRMLGNIAVDLVGGSVPYIGVLFDTVWKANQRNLVLALTDLATESQGTEQSVRIDIE